MSKANSGYQTDTPIHNTIPTERKPMQNSPHSTNSTTPSQPEITFKDSEVMYIAAYHLEEAAKLAFNLDYGDEMQRHVEKIVELSEWFEWVLENRIQPQLDNK